MRKRRVAMAGVLLFLTGSTLPAAAVAQDDRDVHAQLLDLLEVSKGDVVADIGAGGGYLSFLLAERVGPRGFVYASEIDPVELRRLEHGKRDRDLSNVSVVRSTETDPRLPAEVDLQVLSYVYHHLSRPQEFMANALRYLKPGGRLVVAANDINDFRRGFPGREPGDVCTSDPETTREAIEKAGFVFEKRLNLRAGPILTYALFFRAPPAYSPIFSLSGGVR